ncbi:MAG: response regulator [Anaerolineaceae bacterium]|nr:response regulator [Anaerolineaceae bacterium]
MSKTLRVLIVEDSEDDALLLLRELRRGGYEPVHVRVEDAVAMQAALEEREWDVVLSDYSMPRFSAPAALALLQQSGIDLPFIIVSGTIGETVAVAAMKSGAHDFLVKGQMARLIPAVEREMREARVRSERAQAADALRQRENYFGALIENVSDIITTIDAFGQITYVSPAIHRILGYSVDEYEGSSAFDLVHSDDRSAVDAMMAHLLWQPDATSTTQFRVRHRDGSWRWLEAISRRLLAADSDAQEFVIVLRDISTRKQAETEREQLLARIIEQAREVQFIVNTVPEGIFMLNEDGDIRLTNPLAKEYLTLLAPEWANGRLTHLGNRPLTELLTSPPKGLWHELESHGRFFELIARPIEDGPGQRGWVFVLHDATRERQVQQQVQSQERLAAVGQLAAGIAHDFNNSLAVIKLYSDLLLRSAELTGQNQDRLHTISRQTQRAADLIQQILDFSRQSLMERQALDLLPYLKELTRLLKRTLPEDIQVSLEPAADIDFTIFGDPSRIQQVILNLAFNARDAMPQGGRLTVGLEKLTVSTETAVPVSGMVPGEWVQLSIRDSGVGISAKDLDHIFEPFFTTKEHGKGTGLGLAQVYGIVQQHNAFIDVETAVSQGTTFYLYFPAFHEQPQARRVLDESVPLGSAELVLVVEDEETIRQALSESLAMLNYQVLEAENGREAFTLIEQHREEIAVVLSDIIMPEMGGVALFHTLREQEFHIPFIMITGYVVEKDMENLRALGLQGWLTKPLDLDKLAHLLQQALS